MQLSYHNARGQIVTFPIVAEFHDADGRVFYVVGPTPQGVYPDGPPYVVVPKDAGGWRHE